MKSKVDKMLIYTTAISKAESRQKGKPTKCQADKMSSRQNVKPTKCKVDKMTMHRSFFPLFSFKSNFLKTDQAYSKKEWP